MGCLMFPWLKMLLYDNNATFYYNQPIMLTLASIWDNSRFPYQREEHVTLYSHYA